MKGNKRFFRTAGYLLSLHVLGLAILSVIRLTEFVALHHLVGGTTTDSPLGAFVRGLWFDNVVGCYILVVPLVVLLVTAVLGYYRKWLRKFAAVWMSVLYLLAFAVSMSNIPYYAYFAKNINSSIFNWFSYAGTTAGMVVGERSYWLYIALFFIFSALYLWLVHCIWRWVERGMHPSSFHFPPSTIPLMSAILLFALCVFGIRGRTGYNPIKISQAYYCNDPFLNQLGIAPAFNLLTSVLDDMRSENEELRLMPYDEAITLARQSLGLTGEVDSANVLNRVVPPDSLVRRPNIVIILMESMSSALLQHGLTPSLDSLAHASLYFPRFYSAGIHTNHGLTAALYSFPALMKRNLMKGTVTPRRSGIPTVLKAEGYHNMFFMTHEAQYDNMQAFFLTNGYDDVYSQADYPSSEVANAFGVSDHFLFEYGLQRINAEAAKGHPWMATLLTISNHPPYVIPEWFHPHATDPEQQIVEYADWCVGDFLQKARRERWYDQTVFVVMADHGKLVGNVDSELPESYNHIPLYIFGTDIPVMSYDGLATQVDVMPTLLGLLGMGYDYDGFGINLLREQRQMVFYTADDQIAGRDSNGCYVLKPATGQQFYYGIRPESTDSLHRYAVSMVQTAEYLQRQDKK